MYQPPYWYLKYTIIAKKCCWHLYHVILPLMEKSASSTKQKIVKNQISSTKSYGDSFNLCILQVQENRTWNEVVHWEEYTYVCICCIVYMYALRIFRVVIVKKQVDSIHSHRRLNTQPWLMSIQDVNCLVAVS